MLPDAQNGDAATRCGWRRIGQLPAVHSPAVLNGVKGLRSAPVLVDGLRPPLTPSPRRQQALRVGVTKLRPAKLTEHLA